MAKKKAKAKTDIELKLEEDVAEVVAKILAKFSHGSTINHTWFIDNLWISKPEFNKNVKLEYAIREYDKETDLYDFKYMGCIDRVKSALRKERLYMTSIRGIGYKLLTPNEHAQHGVHKLITRTDKAFQKTIQCHNSCELSQLTKKELSVHKAKSLAVVELRKVFNNEASKRGLFKTEEAVAAKPKPARKKSKSTGKMKSI